MHVISGFGIPLARFVCLPTRRDGNEVNRRHSARKCCRNPGMFPSSMLFSFGFLDQAIIVNL